jgi:acetyl esterase
VDLIRGRLARGASHLPAGLQLRLSGGPARTIDGATLDPALQLILAVARPADRAQDILDRPLLGRDRLRRDLLSIEGKPTPVREVQSLEIGSGAGHRPGRLYLPEGQRASLPLLVYYHGGGFVGGDLDTHDEPCRMLAHHAGTAVLGVDYRLAPEHRFPAAVDDSLAAFEWAVQYAERLGCDPRRVSVGGDSAGGNLAAVVSQLATAKGTPPAGQLLIYPPTDRSTPRPSHELFTGGLFLSIGERNAYHEQYAGRTGADPRDPRISPLCTRNLRGLPSALVVIAHFDVLRDEGEAYAAALTAAGVPCRVQREPTLGHGFVNLTRVCRAAQDAVVRMAMVWREISSRQPGS